MKRSALRRRSRKPKRDPNEVWHGPGGEEDSHREFVRSRGCLLSLNECSRIIEVHHVVHQGNGGTFRDLVPLCRTHHTGWSYEGRMLEQAASPVHDGKRTFAARYRIDLPAQAARLLAEHYPEGLPDER